MCNTVAPGLVDTPLANNTHVLQKWLPHNPTWEAVDTIIKENSVIPMGAYQPEDIAKAVEMFCDSATALVTGEVFAIGQGAAVASNA
jgi:NAD(P)-dependent dehydrogenase (short-subunit alcohol dehydrogenase family)